MGAAVNATNNEGFSPVYIATKDKNIDLANLLIKAGGNAQIKTQNSKTTLMTATENNDARMVNKLINIGLETNARTDDGNTALHLAAIKNNSLAADILISNDADYDLQNNEGLTPLMLASAYGSTETVNLLIQSGADITMKDSYGQDAYTLAKNNRQTVIMAMLTSASFRDSQNKSSFDENSGENSSSFVSGVRYEQPFVNPSLQDKSPIRMPIPMFTTEEKNRM
jgi:ankyrin repeat protein